MLPIDLDRGSILASDPRHEGHGACAVMVVMTTDLSLRWAFNSQTESTYYRAGLYHVYFAPNFLLEKQ